MDVVSPSWTEYFNQPMVTKMKSNIDASFIKWFDEIAIEDVPEVGGKNASLGEMFKALGQKGVHVPNGFAVTASAYRHFLAATGTDAVIEKILERMDPQKLDSLHSCGHQIRSAIMDASLPTDLEQAICSAYNRLNENCLPIEVAVRSSATAEDLPEASFAGQQETFLNVKGYRDLLEACRRCFASLFTDRAISYRIDKGFDHLRIGLSVGIQPMIRSDLAASGVMFSIDTETGFRNAVLINASYGLGENIVQGAVNPDEFVVFKPTLLQGHRPILQKKLGAKEMRLIYDPSGISRVRNVEVPTEERQKFAITDDEILTLARWACVIEEHYTQKLNRFCPMDIEWAKDGPTGELYILQARPETVQSQKGQDAIEIYKVGQHGRPLVTGRSVGTKVGKGPVHVINDPRSIADFRPGEVLVTDKTDPDWEPIMKQAAAIVTNRGGRTCHAAIVSRELGLPAIVGANDATSVLHDGQMVTVCCAEGDVGAVYEGDLDFEVQVLSANQAERPRTKIMVNVGDPQEAFSLSFIPNDGVGLAREEFIITSSIKAHPMALLNYEQITDPELKQELEALTAGYTDKSQFFVDKLAEGVAMIGGAFYPKDVIVRLSDFKTNEYANLIGGKAYEPMEENPMLGFRGASRYYDPRYRDAFGLECLAMKKVREEMGLTNVKLMIPFCRTVEEGRKVLAEMEKHGLVRGQAGLEVYVMCEIPSNVILAEQFAEIFDGFSIGSNDLTQLVLGVDRDSEILASVFDERNPAVKSMIGYAIQTARTCGRKIGICGQAPSDYPEFARFLVECGIDSISLNPDSVLKTTLAVLDAEKEQAS